LPAKKEAVAEGSAPWAKAATAAIIRKAVVRNFFMVVLLVGGFRGFGIPGTVG
jgi:hypothetical protein